MSNYLRDANEYIESLTRQAVYETDKIARANKKIVSLEKKRLKLISSLEKLPISTDKLFIGSYDRMYSTEVFDQVCGVEFELPRYYAEYYHATFFAKVKSKSGLRKIYLTNSNKDNLVISNFSRKTKEVTVVDYKSLISDKIQNKNNLIKQIEEFLLGEIVKNKLRLSEKSFNYEFFNRMLLIA